VKSQLRFRATKPPRVNSVCFWLSVPKKGVGGSGHGKGFEGRGAVEQGERGAFSQSFYFEGQRRRRELAHVPCPSTE